jgi:arginyl-tRNA synthetase
VLRKAEGTGITISGVFPKGISLNTKEKELIKTISQFPEVVREAGKMYSPALLANYCYELVKLFNQFYHDHSILNEPDKAHRDLRLTLSLTMVKVLKSGMGMLGIECPDRM